MHADGRVRAGVRDIVDHLTPECARTATGVDGDAGSTWLDDDLDEGAPYDGERTRRPAVVVRSDGRSGGPADHPRVVGVGRDELRPRPLQAGRGVASHGAGEAARD